MFNLQDYETVEERLEKFWKQYPDGRIETELLEASATRFIVVARIFRTEADARYWTSGHAYEVISERGVNSTSALENGETSAIGRALSAAGFATKGKRPSREEMSKAARGTFERTKPAGGVTQPDAWTIKTENPADELEVKESKMPETMNLAEALGSTEEIPHCKHGQMDRREGLQKDGKTPYMGYTCPQGVGVPRSEQCDAIWYELTPSGKWRPKVVK